MILLLPNIVWSVFSAVQGGCWEHLQASHRPYVNTCQSAAGVLQHSNPTFAIQSSVPVPICIANICCLWHCGYGLAFDLAFNMSLSWCVQIMLASVSNWLQNKTNYRTLKSHYCFIVSLVTSLNKKYRDSLSNKYWFEQILVSWANAIQIVQSFTLVLLGVILRVFWTELSLMVCYWQTLNGKGLKEDQRGCNLKLDCGHWRNIDSLNLSWNISFSFRFICILLECFCSEDFQCNVQISVLM